MELSRPYALDALRTTTTATIYVPQQNLCEVSGEPWNQGIQRGRSKKAISKFQIGRNTHGVDAWRLAFLASRAASWWNLIGSGETSLATLAYQELISKQWPVYVDYRYK